MPKLSLNASKKTKHTPAGEIPVDWDYALLDQLAKRGSGHTPSKDFASYWNGGVKWVSLADSNRLDRGFIKETANEISNEGIRKSSAVLHPTNTVILSRDAGVGKSAVLKTPMAVSQHFIAWTCGMHLDPWYLYYWLQQKKPFFERIAVGSTIKTIGLGVFKKLGGAFPPLPEQRRIAKILGTWDRAIETLESLIAAKERRKQAIMEQLLTGRKRLPGFKGKWKQTKFRSFLNESRIAGSHGASARKLTVRLYGKGISEKSETRMGSSNTRYYIRTAGQLIYSKLDFLNGAFAIIPEHLDGLESTLDLPAFDIAPIADARWLLSSLIRPEFYENCIGFAAGGRKARRVNPSEFLNIGVNLPSLEEQQAIATVLDTADRELTLHRQHLATLRTQKRGLMGKLLTGEVRVQS